MIIYIIDKNYKIYNYKALNKIEILNYNLNIGDYENEEFS